VLRIGRLARLGPSSDQVLSKSVTGTTRRRRCRPPICWTSRKLAMDLGDSTNDADACRMLVAKGAAPSRTGLCWLPSRRKDNRACMSSAVQPLRGPDGPGTRARETRVAGTHDAASLIGRAEVMAASLITPQSLSSRAAAAGCGPRHGRSMARVQPTSAGGRMDITGLCYTSGALLRISTMGALLFAAPWHHRHNGVQHVAWGGWHRLARSAMRRLHRRAAKLSRDAPIPL
jgi:hypothetical protein